MTFGPKRGHIMFIFERLFRDFGLLIVYLLLYLIIRDVQILYDNIALAVIAFLMPVKRLIEYLTTYYTIDHEKLTVKSGLFKKQLQEIPLANITAVDFTQPLIMQIAKAYSIHVENAVSLGNAAEGSVKIVLGAEDAVTVKKLLLAKQESYDVQVETPDALATYRASVVDILLMGFLQVSLVSILIQSMAFLGIASGFLAGIIENSKGTAAERVVMMIISNFGPVLLLQAAAVFLVLSFMIGTLISFVKYYGFRITDRGNSLFVEYGLITRKTHTVMKDKISGLVYNQSLMMRIIKRGSLSVFAAGYGAIDEDKQEETVLLYPVTAEAELYSFLEAVLPGFADEPVYEKAPGKALPYYFLCFRFIAAVLLLAGSLLIPAGFVIIRQCAVMIAGFLMIIAVASVIMEGRNSAVSPDTKMIVMRNGGFRRKTTLLVRSKVEFAEDIASERKRRRTGAATLKVGILAPNQYSTCKVRNMKIEAIDAVRGGLLY